MPALGNYATLAELRSEGLTQAEASDARITTLLPLVSRRIDNWTGQFFEPRTLTLYLDGKNTSSLFLGFPVISVTSLAILNPDGSVLQTLETTEFVVFNRHLSGDYQSGDHVNPRITVATSLRFPLQRLWKFPPGSKNIKIIGSFGYTEYDGAVTASGITPLEINYITKLLVIREAVGMAEWSKRRARMIGHAITSETSDGTTWVRNRSEVGAFSQDPDIDRVIMRYRVKPGMGAA